MSIAERFNEFIQKQKQKKPVTLITDILFVLLLILMLIPYTRREIRTYVSRLTMGQPKAVESISANGLNQLEWDFELQNADGNKFELGDFKGDVIFLNFWATWCPPCRAEMPSIQNLYNQFGEQVRFLFVSTEDFNTVHNFLVKNGYNLPAYQPLNQAKGKLSFSAYPTTFVINKSGEIVLQKAGAAHWDSEAFIEQVQQLIAE